MQNEWFYFNIIFEHMKHVCSQKIFQEVEKSGNTESSQ